MGVAHIMNDGSIEYIKPYFSVILKNIYKIGPIMERLYSVTPN